MPPAPPLEVLLETKKDNLNHLNQLLTEPVYKELKTIYDDALKQSKSRTLETFQELLIQIPHWNANRVSALKERIYAAMNCDYFTDLLKATFMVYLKLHLSTVAAASSKPIKIKVPTSEAFLHRLLVGVARFLWKKPYLMFHLVQPMEQQKNLLQCESMIHKAIGQTILNCLPLNEIYRYLSKESLIHSGSAATTNDAEEDIDSAEDTPVETEDTSSSTSDVHEKADDEYEHKAEESETESDATSETESESETPVESETEDEEGEEDEEDEEEEEEEEDEEEEKIQKPDTPEESGAVADVKTEQAEESSEESTSEAEDAPDGPEDEEEPMNLVSKKEIKQIDIHPVKKLHRPTVSKMLPRPKNAFF